MSSTPRFEPVVIVDQFGNPVDLSRALGNPEVLTFADLPLASANNGIKYDVLTSTGVWFVNRRESGTYYSNGTNWTRLGDIESLTGGAVNRTVFDEDGTMEAQGDATTWEDLRFPLQGQRLDVAAGRVDYNYTDCTVDFQSNALYPGDPICFICQQSHSKLLGSAIELHLHWLQNQNATPNWLIGYKWLNTGERYDTLTETLMPWTSNAITYTANTISQLTEFGTITKPVDDTLSSILHIRLFRDTTNVSTLFAGADPYIGDAQATEFDIHYIKDTMGSREEYVK